MQLIACLFLFKNSLSQNLILNESFENYSNINCGGGGFDNYSMISTPHVVDNWYSLNSPDYFNSICGLSGYGAPNCIFGYCYPHQGNAHTGFMLFYKQSDTKEYIYQQLSSPLQAGKLYCLSFYVSRADRKEYAIHSIGAYFSNNIQNITATGYINAVPQVLNQTGFITDTVNWVQIQGCFTANGNEQYITIGNFNSNANTDTLYTGTNNPIPFDPQYSYYYIDDITLIDQSTVGVKEDVGFLNEVVGISPNPSNGLVTVTSRFDFEKIELLSVTGQTLLSEKVIAKTRDLNLTDLSEGIYFVKVSYANGLSTVKKVVKQ